MLNQIILVGRLTRDVQLKKTDNGKKVAVISLAIPRSFKNMDGLYDTDFVDCIQVASNTSEYCHKGDILGVKGRVQSRIYEDEDKKKYRLEVVAEKVTFLSSKNGKETEDES